MVVCTVAAMPLAKSQSIPVNENKHYSNFRTSNCNRVFDFVTLVILLKPMLLWYLNGTPPVLA